MGEHPIMITVVGSIDDIGEDFLAILDPLPQKLEHAPWHLGMSHDAVLCVDQRAFRISRQPHENLIGIRDAALEIGLADDDLIGIKGSFHTG